jgi:hypothetical protein
MWLPYKRLNIKGVLTEYELRIEENYMMGVLNDMFIKEFSITESQFKNLISEGFLDFEYDDLITRYHEDLLEFFEDYIEDDYKEQLEEEKWYFNEEEIESYKDDAQIRAEYGVSEHMFH